MKLFRSTLLLMLLASAGTNAQTVKLFNMQQTGSDQYQLGKTDPHIVFTYALPRLTKGKGVWLNISITTKESANRIFEQAYGELFWANSNHQFENKYRIAFRLTKPLNRIFVPLREMDEEIGRLRVDIDNCACAVKISLSEWLEEEDAHSGHYPQGYEKFKQLKYGYNIPVGSWLGEQVKSPKPGIYDFHKWDPRIINSEPLNLPLDVASGIYFDFDFNHPNKYQKYELFWYLKGSRWSGLRSAHFLLPNNGQMTKQVFIPFDRLQSKKTLLHLRFDFQACPTCRLSLNQARIVGFEELDKYQIFTPERLYHVHTESPSYRFIGNAFINKITADIYFLVFFVLLLISVIILSTWLFLKHKVPSA